MVTDGWLSTVFGYWSIVFLAEGDMQNGDIQLNFIINPSGLRKTIYFLIEHHANMRESNNTPDVLDIKQQEEDNNEFA